MKNMTITTKRISSSINDDNIIELDIREQLTDICPAYSHYAKATLAIAGTLGTVALAKTTGFLPSFWVNSDISPGNGPDNPHQLVSTQETITFTDNSFRTQLTHAKRAFSDEFQININTALDQRNPSVAGLSSGGFVVTWSSYDQDGSSYGIYGRCFSKTGVPQGGEFQVNTYSILAQDYSSVATLGTGDFVVTWQSSGQDGSDFGIYGQRFSSTCVPLGNEFQVNTHTTLAQGNPSIAALGTDDFVVTWQCNGQDGSDFGIYGQRFSSTCVPLGNEFQVNAYTTLNQYGPSVAGLSTGDFVVTWASNGQDGDSYGIYGQRFSNTGVRQGSEFQINTYTISNQIYPSVAALSPDNFVVTWTSNGQDGSNYGIYGQRFSNTGVSQGSEFQINTYTALDQIYPSVAGLSMGDFVVTWTSNGQDGDGNGIYCQRFSNTGARQGSEFQINTYTTSSQVYPSVVALDAGDFVLTWASNGQDGGLHGIYGRIYYNNQAPVLVNNTLTVNEGETVIVSISNLGATDIDNNAAQLTFTVSGVQYGQFERVANAGIAITNFTQQDINDGAIQFVHDGSQNSPSYVVNVSDGVFLDNSQAVNIIFHKITPIPASPEIINDQSIINAKPNVPILVGANTFFNITSANTLSFDTIEITHVDNSLKLKWFDTKAPIGPEVENSCFGATSQ